MEPGYVFISYSSLNYNEALELNNILTFNGINCWMAPQSIPAGGDYADEIPFAIANCSAFILVLSKESQESKWVPKEIDLAIDNSKTIIPFHMDDSALKNAFNFRLTNVQRIEAYGRISEAYQDLIQRLLYIKELLPNEVSSSKLDSLTDFVANDFAICKTNDANHNKVSKEYEQAKGDMVQHIGGHCFTDISLIGRGFAGRVYKAFDERLGKYFVFKKYDVSDAFHIPFFSRMDLGCRLEEIKHNNLCSVYNIIRGAEPSVVMHYIDGDTLRVYADNNTIDIMQGLNIVLQILEGLKVLHNNGIYYGDVTPDNIMISNGNAYLCDYSSSNFNGSIYDDVTLLIHKFRSPERTPGKMIDYKSDIYEVGMILDELTLKLVDHGVATSNWGKDLESFLVVPLNPSPLHNYIVKIIKKATKKDPNKRYSSIDAMINDIKKGISLSNR